MRTFFYVIFKKFSFRFEQNALFKRDKSEREKDLCSYLMVGEEVNSMEQSSSYDEKTVMHQFDRKCKLALKGEIVDYERHLAYLRKHETLFSELSEQEMESLSIFDEYELEKSYFRAGGYDVEVKNALLAEALTALTERKRDIILLSYFVEMNDADIARKLNLVRSTVHEHRTRSLEILKIMLEENADENGRKSVNNKKLIPFWVIERALEGDIQAINKILKHVETICLLSNRKADSHIKLSLDMDEYYDIMDKEKAEKK